MMLKSISTALLATAAFLLPAQAQMRGSVVGVPARGASVNGPFISTGAQGSFHARSGMRHLYSPFIFGDPYYYADYTSQPAAAELPPQLMIVQVPPSAPAEVPQEAKSEMLLIELHGDSYVRIGAQKPNKHQPAVHPGDLEVATAKPIAAAKPAIHPQPPVPELPPVDLVFRDGHREQIHEYTIADGILYARGDYWTDGYWTRKIQLSSLNLPATKQASRERGAEFILPNSPNEVVTGP